MTRATSKGHRRSAGDNGVAGREGLSQRVEELPVVRKATQLWAEGEEAATEWWTKRRHDAEAAMERVRDAVESERELAERRLHDVFDRDQVTARVLDVVDRGLFTVGLMRVARHEQVLDQAARDWKARLRQARRAAKGEGAAEPRRRGKARVVKAEDAPGADAPQ